MDKILILSPESSSAAKITWENTPHSSLRVSVWYRCFLATIGHVLSRHISIRSKSCVLTESAVCLEIFIDSDTGYLVKEIWKNLAKCCQDTPIFYGNSQRQVRGVFPRNFGRWIRFRAPKLGFCPFLTPKTPFLGQKMTLFQKIFFLLHWYACGTSF